MTENPLSLIFGHAKLAPDMLQKENRLAKVRDFNLVIKHGRWTNGQFLDAKVLVLADNQKYFPPREKDVDKFKNQLKLAFTVGLKVSKSAVVRNRVRRQLREVVRLLAKEGRLRSGFYVLFVARPTIVKKNFAEISDEVRLLLKRSSILD